MAMKVKRSSFVMIKVDDDDPDTSYLGKYSRTPGPNDRTIDRKARGCSRNEFQYFIAAMSGKESGNPKSVEEDYQRMERYGSLWGMIGILAQVTLNLPHGKGGTITQTIKSPGLWGIESDSSKKYFDEVFADECETLAKMLTEIGIEVIDDVAKVA